MTIFPQSYCRCIGLPRWREWARWQQSLRPKYLNKELEILENDYRGAGAISYDEKTQATNKFNSSVENEVINKTKEVYKLENEIRLKEMIMGDNQDGEKWNELK